MSPWRRCLQNQGLPISSPLSRKEACSLLTPTILDGIFQLARGYLVRRGVCARQRPLPGNVERRQWVDQAESEQGSAQGGWDTSLRCAVPKLNQWGRFRAAVAEVQQANAEPPWRNGEVSFCPRIAPGGPGNLLAMRAWEGGECVDADQRPHSSSLAVSRGQRPVVRKRCHSVPGTGLPSPR
jgi:hypothetical protein